MQESDRLARRRDALLGGRDETTFERTIARYYLGARNQPKISFFGEAPDLDGKRVPVIDDTVWTRVTMDAVRTRCLERGAARVATLTLFCNPSHPADYAAQVDNCPLVWPWGWESD